MDPTTFPRLFTSTNSTPSETERFAPGSSSVTSNVTGASKIVPPYNGTGHFIEDEHETGTHGLLENLNVILGNFSVYEIIQISRHFLS